DVRAEGERTDTRIARAELRRLRVEGAGHGNEQTVRVHGRPAAIARDRAEDVVAFGPEARPAPLVRAAIRVADEEVDQAGPQELAFVHAEVRTLHEVLEHVLAVTDAARVRPSRRVVRALVRLELQTAEHAGE